MQEENKSSAKRPDERKGSKRVNIRFEDDLLNQIYEQLPDNPNENQRASTPKIGLSDWVKDACRKKLEN